jgi:hypothetical protein
MGMLGKGTGLARAAVTVACFTVIIQPAMAQSTDTSRPGDLFSFPQIGLAAGQVLTGHSGTGQPFDRTG